MVEHSQRQLGQKGTKKAFLGEAGAKSEHAQNQGQSDDGHAISRQEKCRLPKSTARFPAKKRWHSLPPSGCLGTPLPLPQSVRTDGRTDVRMYGRTDGRSRDYYVTTKISRIDRLQEGVMNSPARLVRGVWPS